VLVSILTAFLLSHLIATTYALSYRGLSYSRSFVHTLVLGGVVAAMLMLAIGNNLVWGIGIVGTLAIIRFRTNLRDPRDMVFIFAALAACGSQCLCGCDNRHDGFLSRVALPHLCVFWRAQSLRRPLEFYASGRR
jgi:hypothetical protein